ncbi:MAG: hypothetical protein HND48_25475 [Chloroflexi bacterium]|nr:hypothetical protein [Chloroflexota bacterium]
MRRSGRRELVELQNRFAGREFKLATWAFNNLNMRVIDMIASTAAKADDPLDQPIGPVLQTLTIRWDLDRWAAEMSFSE